jgi:hypothetical protein
MEGASKMKSVSRRSFLKTAGIAAGAAAASVATPALADPGPVVTEPSTSLPDEPVIAIVRDAGRGEVTVLAGTTEKTYRDRQLASRILKAARANVGGRDQGLVA